jgi:cytosine/adenosine deaminase-related metal-dependent hydrolase
VLPDVTVVRPGEGRRPHRWLSVTGGEIAAIRQGAAPSQGAPPLTRYAGSYVLPGLIDMHFHYPPARLPGEVALAGLLLLRHGVTTVRDTGSLDGSIFRVREQVRAGRLPGPRIFTCGRILNGADLPPPSRVVRDAAQARRAVAELAADGADCVKVYNDVGVPALLAIRDEARRRELPVIGHVPFGVRFDAAGLADVQHLTGVVPLPHSPEVPLKAVSRAWITLSEERMRFVVDTSVRQGIAHTPTLVVMKRFASLARYASERRSPEALLLPRHYRDIVWAPDRFPLVRDFAGEELALFDHRLAVMQRLVGRLHRAGVAIFAGTDPYNPFVVPGVSLHEELALLAEAGLGREGAWRAATAAPGRFLAVPGLGRLEEGGPADFALYGDDPTRKPEAFDSLQAVVVAGRLYTREELDRSLARLRRFHANRVYEFLAAAVARRLFPARAPRAR